ELTLRDSRLRLFAPLSVFAICRPCELAATGDVHGDDAPAACGVSHVVSAQLEPSNADEGNSECVCECFSDADANAQSGVSAGAEVDEDRGDVRFVMAGAREQTVDVRQQFDGVVALAVPVRAGADNAV